jgi:hypothetical protein
MEERPSIFKAGLNSGLIVGLAAVIYSFILLMLDLSTHKVLNNLSFLIILGGIIWAHQNYKKTGDGSMSYGEGLGIGTVLSGVVGLFSGIFMVIYITLIDPNYLSRIMAQEMVKLQDQGISQSQIDQMEGFTSFFQSPIFIFFSALIGSIFAGFILSLIVSAFTKKNKNIQYS